jgi:hypothetical protein
MRKSSIFFWSLLAQVCLLSLLLAHASLSAGTQQANLAEKAAMVRALRLTDLCLFTEARYTRHLSQADLNTPFQDHPLSLDHFPSGSLTLPPEGLTRRP